MHTTSASRIEELTAAGHWGQQTLHGLLAKHANATPEKLAGAVYNQ